MTGAELLAVARHSRDAEEQDHHTAMHLATALSLIFWQLTPEQRERVARLLREMED